MNKLLLLGGTGAMGVYLREILAAEGHHVLVTSRSARPSEPNIEYRVGNARDISFVRDLLAKERPDAVVDFMIYSSSEFAARRDVLLNGTRHYLFLSSYRVFNDDDVITEESPRLLDTSRDQAYLTTDEYALCKARSEDALRRASSRNWTIIRPAITYSKSRFQLGCLEANSFVARSLKGLPVVMPPEMRERETTLTWGHDVALMIAKLVLNPKAYGEAFNCATAEHHPWGEVCKIYADVIGTKVCDCSVDEYIYITGAEAQVRYDRMFNRVLDNSKVLSVTGLRQEDFVSLRDGLTRELKWFVANGASCGMNAGVCARMDRVLGCHSSLRGIPWRDQVSYVTIRHPVASLPLRALRFAKHRIFT